MKEYIEAAKGNKKADLVLKNGNIIDVFNCNVFQGDIAICGEKIVGIGEYSGNEEINCKGLYISPGFIDSHVHIESSRVTPKIFSNVLLKNGVLTAICDPHEIGNVLGVDGIEYMLENSKNASIDLYYMMPSCVPATPLENNGATLLAKDLEKFIGRNNVLGLGEVMDVPSVLNFEKSMIDKLNLFKDKIIDGHSPLIEKNDLNAYILAGVKTDHECETKEEALEKIRRGMYVMLRLGSAARNLPYLLPGINDNNYRRYTFCTDDKDISDLVQEGSINYNIKLSVELGLDPIKAVTIGSFNAALCYGLKDKGAIAPGYIADILILDNLKDFNIKEVIRKGKIVKEEKLETKISNFKFSMNIEKLKKEDFNLKADSEMINVIKVIENSLVTEKVIRKAIIENGWIKGIEGEDILKIGVFERHKRTGKHAIGFIEGFHLNGITIAQTIAHDSHNLIVIGNDYMEKAANRVIEIGGGIVLLKDGEIIQELSLPIAGLLTEENPETIISKLDEMNNYINNGEKSETNVLLTLGFMALTVIPYLKITERGLYDYKKGSFISIYSK